MAIAVVELSAQIIGYDRLGNGYTAEDLAVPAGGQPQMMGGGGFCNPCNAGIFELTFLPGSGLEMNTPLGIARQQVAIQVFEDLSVLIEPANDPYTLAPNTAPFVQVQFRSTATVAGVDWTQTLGFGSTIRNFVNTEAALWCNSFTSVAQREGIMDGEVWRTINGGIDSWATIFTGLLNQPQTEAHGFIALNFSGTPTNLYTGQTLPPVPATDADLYLVIAHEAMHMLGVETLIQTNGSGLNNTRYYSRYDQLVHTNAIPWITDPQACTNWATNVGNVTDLLTGSCGDIELDGATINPNVPLFPGNLPHFDGVCGNLPYLMHPDNSNPLGASRIPLQEEVNVLCDMDYHTTTEHGFSGTAWDGTYQLRTPCGLRLAGVDDLYADYTTLEYYSVQQPGSIIIDNFLDNDEDQFLSGEPVAFTCLEVLFGGGTAAIAGPTSINFTPDPTFVGTAILRYKPRNVATDRTGNFTFIFIEVWPIDACDACNIVNGGDFENITNRNRGASPHFYFARSGALLDNTPDHISWLSSMAEWRNSQDCGNATQKCGPATVPIQDSWNGQASGNEHYVALGDFQSGFGEGVLFQLCSPMVAGETYDIEFRGTTGGTCSGAIRFYAFTDRPCSPAAGSIDFAAATPCTNGIAPYPVLAGPVNFSGPAWSLQSNTVAYAGPTANWVIAISDDPAPPNSFIFVDDFVIHPHIELSGVVEDACTAQNNGSIALSIDYPAPFTVSWSNGATTAFIDNLAPGLYTATVNVLGCVLVEDFTVGEVPCGDPFTLTKTVAPMPTYAYAPVFFTITACNNTASPESVVLIEQYPAGFVMTGSIPSLSWPNVTITLPAGGCETYVINGYFTTIGPDQNCVSLDPVGTGADVVACVPTDILEGCPMMVYGNGGCDPGSTVDMCLGVHTIIPDVSAISYWMIYPDYLVPPAPGALTAPVITSPFTISSASIGVPQTLSWPPGYMAVPVTVNFNPLAQVSPPYGFFCIDFTVGPGGVPAGINTAWTWASAVSPNADPLLEHWNHVGITTAGSQAELWTQAYLIQFDCVGPPGPDASFSIDQILCTGEVSVTGAFTDPNAVHSWIWGDNRTTPTNGAPSYTYNYFSTITNNQGWPVNPSIGPAPPGTYTITHTVVLNGVASTSSQQVTVEPCCQAGTIIPDGSLASVVGTVFSGTIDVQGQFIVDDDVLFQNCQVYMEPGAEIIVQNGWTLDLDNASFTACNGIMWKSITAEYGSTVRIRRSYMDDAESTVAALDGSTVWIDRTQFHNNRVGVGIPDVGSTYNNVACWVSNSTFYSAGTMPQPYQGQTTAVGTKGFAAVDVHNTSLDFTGGNNLIHTLSNGIVGHGSDMSVAGCQMLNIKPDAAYAYSGNGAGIYANGLMGWNTLKQQGYGMNSSMPSFNGCRWGVYTEYMNVRSTENRMLDMGTAYRVDRSGYREVDILNNKAFTHLHGMELRSNDGAAHILVQNNDITFGDAQCDFCRGYTAILVTEGNYVAPDSRILNNTIRFINAPNSRFGIALTSADDWVVAENNVIMASNAFNLTGIQMTGCRRTEVSCNSVNSSDNTYPIDRQAAIRNVMGREPLISCNEMDQTANGILFNGVAYNTDVRGNQFHDHRWPLHLDATAIIDAQTLKGNLWDPNATAPVLGAWYEVSNLQAWNSLFLYDPNVTGTWPPTWSPPSWFDITSGNTYDCANHHGEHYCNQFGDVRCKDCLRELDEKIANDSLENDPYTDETKWMLTADLYKKLDDSPALLDSLPELDAFYTDLQGSITAAFKAIADDQLALYNLDSNVVAQLQANQAQIDALMDLVKDGMEQLADSTLTPAQQQGILSGLSGYRQSINSLSAWNASALQLASTTKVLTAEGVKTANSVIATTQLIEGNEKAVNEVFLATIGKDVDGFTANQSDDLFAIANQCPMVGGNAVFKARSLYWLIDDSYDFDDQALCLQHGIIVKSLTAKPVNAISVVPNPARDEAALVLDRELDEPGTFVVYDAVGAEVMRLAVPIEMPRIAFSTSSLAPAMYHYQVRGPSGVIGVGKLTIVR
ncbi:MAG TPA: hypothetical protein PLB89_01590 [Flavobacteriales bacterium]|nr:hypothetical protein [Flavobacteriales bacterium]